MKRLADVLGSVKLAPGPAGLARRTPRAVRRLGAPLRPFVLPRRIRAYGVGTGKSGTQSLVGLVSGHYRSAHEPGALELIRKVLALGSGAITRAELDRYVRKRDRRLWLEFEASQLLVYLLDELVSAFPEARFVLTIRDCYSYLDSATNHELSRPIGAEWRAIADVRCQASRFRHGPGEASLRDVGLYTLDGYLSYWAWHQRRVLDAVPRSRLLVVRTSDLGSPSNGIAEFLGVPETGLDGSAAHLNRAVERRGIVGRLDPDLIERKVDEHCRDLMDEFYPEMRLADSGVAASV